jgi:hypothetical protein
MRKIDDIIEFLADSQICIEGKSHFDPNLFLTAQQDASRGLQEKFKVSSICS